MTKKRKTGRSIASKATPVVVSTLVTVLLLEGVFRLAGVGEVPRRESVEIQQFDERLGWSKRPGVTATFESAEFQSVETINSRGLRGPEREIPKPHGVQRVLLLGDSFLEGRAVHEDLIVSRRLEVMLQEGSSGDTRVETVNGGTLGYSTDQELLYFRYEGVAYEPDVTVLLFFLNDVPQNALDAYGGDVKPLFDFGTDGTPVLVELGTEGRPTEASRADRPVSVSRRTSDWLRQNSRFYRVIRLGLFGNGGPLYRWLPGARVPAEWSALQTNPDAETAYAWRMTEALLRMMRDEVNAAGSEFLILYVPSIMSVRDAEWQRIARRYPIDPLAYDPGQDAEMLGSICDRVELTCIIDLEAFRRADAAAPPPGLYFAEDAHWTPQGHALAAELIAAGVLPLLNEGSD